MQRSKSSVSEDENVQIKRDDCKTNQILTGYYHYYGITDNTESITAFRYNIMRSLFYCLNRRSQKKSYNWVEFLNMLDNFWHPNDEGGMAWNDSEIGIEWPELKGEYKGSASAEGYTLKDGTALNLSDKDQKWLGLKDTFKF